MSDVVYNSRGRRLVPAFSKFTPEQKQEWLNKRAEQRFVRLSIPQGECVVFVGNRDGCGYGMLRRGTIYRKAHRYAWERANGPIPEGMCVLHHCDNPPCVKVEHLFLGTQKDNALDREAKGRGGDHSGTNNGRAKLTPRSVRFIRSVASRFAVNKRVMGRAFGVSDVVIHNVIRRKSWNHVQGE